MGGISTMNSKSRYPLDHDFDKKRFSDLLKKAQGNRTQLQFSQDIGMSESYLSCYIGEKKEKPLTPNTLRKISKASQNGVSLEELFDASGYTDLYDKMIPRLPADFNNTAEEKPLNQEIVYKNILSSALADKGYTWQGKPVPERIESVKFDISIFNAAINEWQFIFLQNNYMRTGANIDFLPNQLLSHTIPKSKVSLVTHLKEHFDDVKNRVNYPTLLVYLSLILVNANTLQVEEEVTLPTACEDSEEIPKLK